MNCKNRFGFFSQLLKRKQFSTRLDETAKNAKKFTSIAIGPNEKMRITSVNEKLVDLEYGYHSSSIFRSIEIMKHHHKYLRIITEKYHKRLIDFLIRLVRLLFKLS